VLEKEVGNHHGSARKQNHSQVGEIAGSSGKANAILQSKAQLTS